MEHIDLIFGKYNPTTQDVERIFQLVGMLVGAGAEPISFLEARVHIVRAPVVYDLPSGLYRETSPQVHAIRIQPTMALSDPEFLGFAEILAWFLSLKDIERFEHDTLHKLKSRCLMNASQDSHSFASHLERLRNQMQDICAR